MSDSGSGKPTKRDRTRAVASEVREYARGSLDVDHRDVGREAALVDGDTQAMLTWARQAWRDHAQDVVDERDDLEGDELPRDLDATDWYGRRVEQAATATLGDAVATGNVSVMEYVTGMPTYENDVSGLHTTRRVEDWLCGGHQTALVYIAALMGAGKTDLSLTFMEVVEWHYRRLRQQVREVDGLEVDDVPRPDFAANFAVDVPDSVPTEVAHIDNYDDLMDWADGGSSADVRWFVFDEASTELTAQSGANAQDVAEVFAPFVKKMRKFGIDMVVIGHDRGDVHPAVREIADFVSKPATKKARVYEGVTNRKPVGHLFDLDRVPETSWSYDTDDTAEWSWGSATDADGDLVDLDPLDTDEHREWRNERIERLYHDYDLSQSDVADVMSISQQTVSRIAGGTA